MSQKIDIERVLFIIRGIPGSGKSTFANLIADKVCTADDYYMVNGEYQFDINKIHDAHQWCQRKCAHYMRIGVPKLAVANTSTKESEVDVYMKLAEKYNYTVFSIIMENRHGGETIHNVPKETIQKMRDRFSIKL